MSRRRTARWWSPTAPRRSRSFCRGSNGAPPRGDFSREGRAAAAMSPQVLYGLPSGDVAGGDDLTCFAAGGGPAQEAGERAARYSAGDHAERSTGRVAAVLDRRAGAADALVFDRVYRLGER